MYILGVIPATCPTFRGRLTLHFSLYHSYNSALSSSLSILRVTFTGYRTIGKQGSCKYMLWKRMKAESIFSLQTTVRIKAYAVIFFKLNDDHMDNHKIKANRVKQTIRAGQERYSEHDQHRTEAMPSSVSTVEQRNELLCQTVSFVMTRAADDQRAWHRTTSFLPLLQSIPWVIL